MPANQLSGTRNLGCPEWYGMPGNAGEYGTVLPDTSKILVLCQLEQTPLMGFMYCQIILISYLMYTISLLFSVIEYLVPA